MKPLENKHKDDRCRHFYYFHMGQHGGCTNIARPDFIWSYEPMVPGGDIAWITPRNGRCPLEENCTYKEES